LDELDKGTPTVLGELEMGTPTVLDELETRNTISIG